MSDSILDILDILDILALFAVPRRASVEWSRATEPAMRCMDFLHHYARAATQVCFALCEAGHPFVVTIPDLATVRITHGAMSADVSIAAEHPIARVSFAGFPSPIVPISEQQRSNPLGCGPNPAEFDALYVLGDVMRRLALPNNPVTLRCSEAAAVGCEADGRNRGRSATGGHARRAARSSRSEVTT